MRHTKSLPVAVAVTGALLLAACGQGGPGEAATGGLSDDKVVIGVLNDASGVYKDLSGPNSVEAVMNGIAIRFSFE